MKEQNTYEWYFGYLLMRLDFDLVKYSDGWGLEDRHSVVGEPDERFQNARQIINRLESFIDTQVIDPMKEVLADEFDIEVGEDISRMDFLVLAKEYLSYDYEVSVNILDMLVNHIDKINLERCNYKVNPTVYCVDLRHKVTGDTYMTIFRSNDYDTVWEVANTYNQIHGITEHEYVGLENGETEGLTPHPYWASVYEDQKEIFEPEEVKEMKKYTLKDYQKFCDEALIMPPLEDDEHIEEWFNTHKIQIIANGCMMELDYDADAVNEIDFALKEIHEAILGSGVATTGNTVGSQYRPAELKDVVRHFIMCRYENWGGLDWFDYAKQAVVEMSDITSVIGVYEHALKIEKDIDFKCNWHNFKIESLKDATEEGIKKIILDMVGSEIEISYDPHTDKSFVIDYTFKDSGDFIGWLWGSISDDETRMLLKDYKTRIFADIYESEEN